MKASAAAGWNKFTASPCSLVTDLTTAIPRMVCFCFYCLLKLRSTKTSFQLFSIITLVLLGVSLCMPLCKRFVCLFQLVLFTIQNTLAILIVFSSLLPVIPDKYCIICNFVTTSKDDSPVPVCFYFIVHKQTLNTQKVALGLFSPFFSHI